MVRASPAYFGTDAALPHDEPDWAAESGVTVPARMDALTG
jgi:hypothetical protein